MQPDFRQVEGRSVQVAFHPSENQAVLYSTEKGCFYSDLAGVLVAGSEILTVTGVLVADGLSEDMLPR